MLFGFQSYICVENDGTYETDLQISSDVIVDLYRRSTGTIGDLSRSLNPGIPHNDDYTVRVRIPGGEWKDLFEYNVQVDMDNVQKRFHGAI